MAKKGQITFCLIIISAGSVSANIEAKKSVIPALSRHSRESGNLVPFIVIPAEAGIQR